MTHWKLCSRSPSPEYDEAQHPQHEVADEAVALAAVPPQAAEGLWRRARNVVQGQGGVAPRLRRGHHPAGGTQFDVEALKTKNSEDD